MTDTRTETRPLEQWENKMKVLMMGAGLLQTEYRRCLDAGEDPSALAAMLAATLQVCRLVPDDDVVTIVLGIVGESGVDTERVEELRTLLSQYLTARRGVEQSLPDLTIELFRYWEYDLMCPVLHD